MTARIRISIEMYGKVRTPLGTQEDHENFIVVERKVEEKSSDEKGKERTKRQVRTTHRMKRAKKMSTPSALEG